MKIKDIASVVEGSILCSPEAADTDIASACAFDMMSDVLAYVRDQGALITGLVNPQVVRTAGDGGHRLYSVCVRKTSRRRHDQTRGEL